MGAVGGMLGLGGGAGGTSFAGPAASPVTPEQLAGAQTGVQNSMQGQQNLLTALQGQGGLQNQSNVYGQLQGVANGQGPNPAQAMLNQATGANVANQAALMAGQRGAGANVGMMARQAGQQGAGIQQQAAGQGATMQAQQSLGALGQMGGMANQQAGQQIGQTNAINQAQQAQQNTLMNAQVSSQNSANAANAAMANQRMGQQTGAIGGLLNAAGPALSNFGSWIGSGISGLGSAVGAGAGTAMAGGTEVAPALMLAAQGGQVPSGPRSLLGQRLACGGGVPAMVSPGEKYLSPQAVEQVKQGANPMEVGETIPGKPKVGGAKNSYSNDTVPKTLEEGGIVVPRKETKSANPDKKSAEFVQKVLAKRKVGKK